MVNETSDVIPCFQSMEKQVFSLPTLLEELLKTYHERVESLLNELSFNHLQRLYLVGSGDSNFVGLTTKLAFEALAGIPMEVMTSLQFSRYSAKYFSQNSQSSSLMIGVSVSGRSSRTREALMAAKKKGIETVALTAQDGDFTRLADHALIAATPEFPDPEPNGTPGVRSFVANHLMLIVLALHIGKKKNHLSIAEFDSFLAGLKTLPQKMEEFLSAESGNIHRVISQWSSFNEYVFVGAGPHYGSALFAAAKFIEASGDFTLAQETEEWAHLNYYNRASHTPTIIISAGQSDATRTEEILQAAQKIGRQVLLIACRGGGFEKSVQHAIWVPSCEESVMPIYLCAISSLMASYRADFIGEVYFRANHTLETSKIRDSKILETE